MSSDLDQDDPVVVGQQATMVDGDDEIGSNGEEIVEAVPAEYGPIRKENFQIGHNLKELPDDQKGHFSIYPETDRKTYPSRQEAFEKLSEMHEGFSKMSGFTKITPKLGETYYFISRGWIKELLTWLNEEGEDDDDELSLAVDNTKLVEFGTRSKIKKNYLASNAQVVTEGAWKLLVEWFGGGPEIGIHACKDSKGIVRVDSSGKLLRVIAQGDNERFRRFLFSSNELVKDAKAVIAATFDKDPEQFRMHDFYKSKPFARIDEDKNLKTELASRHLMEDNLIFLEFPDENGNYQITYTHRTGGGGYSTPSTDTWDHAGYSSSGYSTKGVVGLRNLGNTCYMNSMIQCLSNVPMLKEAFLSKAFEPDINMDNVLGYEGKVAKAFYGMMSMIWSGQGKTLAPYGFKKVISEAKTDFAGFEQHDSQEFLSELLDGLHEDLNRVKVKPITESVEQRGRPDEIVSAESLETYKMRNDSIISDLFTGLYKSTVTCPDETCGNVSVTFDPFMILPLPLQSGEKPYHVIQIVHIPMDPRAAPQRLEVIVPKHGPFLLLRDILKKKLGIDKINEAAAARAKAGKEIKEDLGNVEKVAQIFSENDPINTGKRDVMVFQVKDGRISDFCPDTKTLSRLSTSQTLLSLEVFNERKFEYFCFQPEEDWKRKLETDRAPRRRHHDEYDDAAMETDSEGEYGIPMAQAVPTAVPVVEEEAHEPVGVGLVGCPFLAGDTWHGMYIINEAEQHLRLEVVGANPIGYDDYVTYKQDVLENYGIPQADTELTEEDFANKHVFAIHAVADSKERILHPSYIRGRTMYHTAFEVRGLYIKDKDVLVNNAEERKSKVRKSVKEAGAEGLGKDAEQKSQGSGKEKEEADKRKDIDDTKRKKIPSFGGFSLPWRSKTKSSRAQHDIKDPLLKSKKSKGIESAKEAEKNSEAIASKKNDHKLASSSKSSGKSSEDKNGLAVEDEEELSAFKRAQVLKPGELEKEFLHGRLVLRPTGKTKKLVASRDNYYSNYGGGYGRSANLDDYDDSRHPIILSGVVDKSHCYLWGKFQVDQGFNKGEFQLQKYETVNWEAASLKITPHLAHTAIVTSRTKFPEAQNQDSRLLVLLCHRLGGRTYKFGSIPEAFFAPFDCTESDIMEIIKARFRIYLEETLKLGNETETVVDSETGEEVNQIDELLRTLKVIRSTPRFATTYHNTENLRAGRRLDEQSDRPFRVADTFFVYLVCDWEDGVPFEPFRSKAMFDVEENVESKMTLASALNLFSQTEKLNSMNAWYCSKCKTHQEAYKQLQVWSLPQVLVVQFKRFSQDEGRSVADKLEIPVDFPFEIDLKDFALSYNVIKREGKGSVKESMAEMGAELAQFEYSLVGVSSHVGGGLGFGHYIACAKNEIDGKWYEFNDALVTEINENNLDRIVNPQAYVLFYVRKSLLKERTEPEN